MDKQKELQVPLRKYFVFMFCSVLVTTSIIAHDRVRVETLASCRSECSVVATHF